MAYYKIEPFGTETQYFGPAITSAVIANIWRGKDGKPHSADEFMPHREADAREQTVDEQIGIAAMLTAVNGGQDLRLPDIPFADYDENEEGEPLEWDSQ